MKRLLANTLMDIYYTVTTANTYLRCRGLLVLVDDIPLRDSREQLYEIRTAIAAQIQVGLGDRETT
jgi:hypothetical protein